MMTEKLKDVRVVFELFGKLDDLYISVDKYEIIGEDKQYPNKDEIIIGYTVPEGSLIDVITKNSEIHVSAVSGLDLTIDEDDCAVNIIAKQKSE
ncbi:MAG: hypothetical protein QXU79_04610 [Candidatus Micrarchaeaceae archaeon]